MILISLEAMKVREGDEFHFRDEEMTQNRKRGC